MKANLKLISVRIKVMHKAKTLPGPKKSLILNISKRLNIPPIKHIRDMVFFIVTWLGSLPGRNLKLP